MICLRGVVQIRRWKIYAYIPSFFYYNTAYASQNRSSKHIPFHRLRYSHHKARTVSWQFYLYKGRVYPPGASATISIIPRPFGIYSAAAMIAASHPALKGLSAQILNGPTHLLHVLTKDSKRHNTCKTCVVKTAIRTDTTIFIDWLALICFYTSPAKKPLSMFVCLCHH